MEESVIIKVILGDIRNTGGPMIVVDFVKGYGYTITFE